MHSGDSACVLPAPSLTAAQARRDRRHRAPARSGARRRRAPQRAARDRRRRGLRARGEPARVADGSVRDQGDRREPRRRRVPARRGRDGRRPRAAAPRDAARGERQGGGAPVPPLPGRRSGARPGDALDRRGDGDRRRPADRVREGRARRGPAAADAGTAFLSVRDADKQTRSCRSQPRSPVSASGSSRLRARRRRSPAQGSTCEVIEKGQPRRRSDPPRPLRPRRQHAAGSRRAHRRLPDPRGRARRARPVHHDPLGRGGGGARDRATRAPRSRSLQERIDARDASARSVVGVEAVGPYTLLTVERGGLEPGVPGQFFMLEAPGRVLPRPMSLCLAPPGELGFLIDPIGPGTRALCALAAGRRDPRPRPARQRLPARRRAAAARRRRDRRSRRCRTCPSASAARRRCSASAPRGTPRRRRSSRTPRS